MKACEHEFENANCTNCANGLPSSAYECAKTKGELKEQNVQNSIIEALKPKGSAGMLKEITCNCTKEQK